jgi:hypothetical protein
LCPGFADYRIDRHLACDSGHKQLSQALREHVSSSDAHPARREGGVVEEQATSSGLDPLPSTGRVDPTESSHGFPDSAHVILDLILLWTLWPSVARGEMLKLGWRELSGIKTAAWAATSLLLIPLVFAIATFPGEWLNENLPPLNFIPTEWPWRKPQNGQPTEPTRPALSRRRIAPPFLPGWFRLVAAILAAPSQRIFMLMGLVEGSAR